MGVIFLLKVVSMAQWLKRPRSVLPESDHGQPVLYIDEQWLSAIETVVALVASIYGFGKLIRHPLKQANFE
jgi:hypothetical protein